MEFRALVRTSRRPLQAGKARAVRIAWRRSACSLTRISPYRFGARRCEPPRKGYEDWALTGERLEVRCGGQGQTFDVVAAFQHRDQFSIRLFRGNLEDDARQRSEIVIG